MVGHGEVFKYVDEKGTVHFTEDPSTIPEKYRDKVKARDLDESDPYTPFPLEWGNVVRDERGSQRQYIVGSVTNKTTREFSFLTLDFSVYDSYGIEISVESFTARRFQAGETRGFEIWVPRTRARVIKFKGYRFEKREFDDYLEELRRGAQERKAKRIMGVDDKVKGK
jgi:hypothetical protein